MLTISKLSNKTNAGLYYSKDNYYTKEEGIEHSLWRGEGAKLLNLQGAVDPELFNQLLRGNVDGIELGRIVKGKRIHRPGYDLTLSAPKSVSILSEIFGVIELRKAHEKAVSETVKFVEQHFIETRIKLGTDIQREKTRNAVVASFTHDVSRELDPQLHTHNVFLNMTNAGVGWRSLTSELLFKNQLDIGMVYRSNLATELQQLGYTLRKHRSDPRLFELEGVSDELIALFSKRAKQIEAYFEKRGIEYDTTLAKQIALTTRKNKENVERDVLHKLWELQAKDKGLTQKLADELVKAAKKNRKIDSANTPEKDAKLAKKAVDRAIRHLTEREMSFLLKDLKKEAFRFSFGELSYTEIFKDIERRKKKGELLEWEPEETQANKGQALWTTPENKEKEKRLIELVESNRLVMKVFVDEKKLDKKLQKTGLNAQQRESVLKALTSKDRFFAIQGDAGVGKTTTLNVLKTIALRDGNYNVIAMAPTHQAVSELSNSLKIDGFTVDRFLLSQELQKKQSKGRSLWIIDEASMPSTEKVTNIMNLAVKMDARVLLVGDEKQLESVEAGRAFAQLLRNGIDQAHITKRLRQQNEVLQSVIDNIIKKNYSGALSTLNHLGKLHEFNGETTAIDSLVNKWISLDPKTQENTLIVAPANEQHLQINERIRYHYKQAGMLDKLDYHFEALVDKHLTKEERSFAVFYNKGEVIRFNKEIKRIGKQKLNIQEREYFSVIGINKEKNTVALRSQKNKRLVVVNANEINTGRVAQHYQAQQIKLAKNDKVRWVDTKNDYGLKRNEELIVERVNSNFVRFKREDGKTVKFEVEARGAKLHLKHNYAKTSYGVQGSTSDNVMTLMQSWRRNTTNSKAFMVASTRARHSVEVFTDNVTKLISGLIDRPGENTEALKRDERQRVLTEKRKKQRVLRY